MRRFSFIFLTLAAVLSTAAAAQAEPVVRTPIAAPIEITGRTGGSAASTCGNINPAAGQVVQVTESFTSLNFEVQSQGDYTLLITGPNGFEECVFAHNYDGGVIQAPGLLNQGEYQLFVGDRRGERHPYTIVISQ